MLYVRTQIVPDAACVILRGQPSEASCESLAGRVLIRLGYSLKVKRVTVAFQSIDARKQQHRRQNTIRSSTLMQQDIFDASDSQLGHAVWPATYGSSPRELLFSFIIPGHMHESVRTAFGNIAYELRVTIHTCGFGINTWTQTQRIPVYRVPLEGSGWALSLTDSMCVQADWLGAVELQMVGDSVAFADKSKLRARAIVRPLQKGQMLADVGLRLCEKVRCKNLVDRFGDLRSSQHTVCEQMRKVYDPSDSLQMQPLNHERCFDLELDIPDAATGCVQYSMNTASLCVTHELTLVATVVDQQKDAHLLRISAPVQIVPTIALEASFAELPEYSKSCFDRLLLDSSTETLWPEHSNHAEAWRSPPPPPFVRFDNDTSDGSAITPIPPSYHQHGFGGYGMLVS
ncbi:hypothetical protein IW140_000503 [Coemansia sp. RSA 1813]|nr:hypothetical protein EV178_004013 [Coemansia sp. RSA 1646]KAJ1773968.1 hypothetical protein LPJ74_000067 [Coemansia sp. RSA 1843]KAJ2213397.1 hypothetical protein EV179_003906 [Coemansia sp. RSA 487]KAJ2572740.1 hypothetical protein IW140_000503 [Coemansia sp. RSA 1813]